MRMRSYTLHLPADARPGESLGLDRALLVRDGFSWPAFAFTVLWFLFHRLWLAALLVLVGLVALAAAGIALGLPAGAGRSLNRWLEASPPAPRAPFPSGPSRRAEPVIGLFPAQEGAR